MNSDHTLTETQKHLIDAALAIKLSGSSPWAGSNGIGSITYLAVNAPAVLAGIVQQAARSGIDFTFWHGRLSHSNLSYPGTNKITTFDPAVKARQFRDSLVLVDQARKHLRTHRGNPEWAVMSIMIMASDMCAEGGLDATVANLTAALYGLLITDSELSNHDGYNNQLIEYMADRTQLIESVLPSFDSNDLSIAHFEAFFDESLASSLRDGFL